MTVLIGPRCHSDGVISVGRDPGNERLFRLELHAPDTPVPYQLWMDEREAEQVAEQILAILNHGAGD